MTEKEDFDQIEELKKRLYQKGSGTSKRPRTKLSPRYGEVKTAWEEAPVAKKIKRYSNPSLLWKFLIASFVFFVGTLIVAGFIIFQGSNVVSNRNIDLVMRGPASVKAGDETTFQVAVSNRNNVPLERVKLTLTYPDDTRIVSEEAVSANREVFEIGTIRSGQNVNRTARAILFGRENEEREVQAVLEYRIPGSNAFFEKRESIKFVISSPPASINVRTLPEVIAGGEAIIEITAVSNAQTPLSDIVLNATYPLGFNLTGASVEPASGNNVWRLGSLSPGEERRITLRGTLDGQDQELKTFNFSIGVEDSLRSGRVGDLYSQAMEFVTVKSPFVNVSLVVNNRTLPQSVLSAGETIRVDVVWENNLPTPVVDAEILVTLDGNIIDEARVNAGNGFYSSGARTISWNRARFAPLTEILPGQRGQTSFTFSTHSLTSAIGAQVLNPEARIGVTLRAIRISPGFAGEQIVSESEHQIRFNSNLQFSSEALHTMGPFENTGSVPPRVNQETTYNIRWSLKNSSNELSNIEVKTVLPPSVRWLGNISPGNESLVYNDSTGELIWRVPRLSPAAGPASGTREVFFHVGLTPSANQIGNPALLTGEMNFSANDNFTGGTISGNQRASDTVLMSDPGVGSDGWSVID